MSGDMRSFKAGFRIIIRRRGGMHLYSSVPGIKEGGGLSAGGQAAAGADSLVGAVQEYDSLYTG